MGEIKEDQKAKLSVIMPDNTLKEFDCLVKEVSSDRISLSFPDELLDYSEYFSEGSELPVKIYTPSGIRAYDSIVINSPLENDFVIEYVEDSLQIQRRKYLRAEVRTKVVIERRQYSSIVTHTYDIGGGGVRFYYAGEFETNEVVKCMLFLPKSIKSVPAKGIILDAAHLRENEHVMFFTHIEEKERDRIIKACFENDINNYREDEKVNQL